MQDVSQNTDWQRAVGDAAKSLESGRFTVGAELQRPHTLAFPLELSENVQSLLEAEWGKMARAAGSNLRPPVIELHLVSPHNRDYDKVGGYVPGDHALILFPEAKVMRWLLDDLQIGIKGPVIGDQSMIDLLQGKLIPKLISSIVVMTLRGKASGFAFHELEHAVQFKLQGFKRNRAEEDAANDAAGRGDMKPYRNLKHEQGAYGAGIVGMATAYMRSRPGTPLGNLLRYVEGMKSMENIDDAEKARLMGAVRNVHQRWFRARTASANRVVLSFLKGKRIVCDVDGVLLDFAKGLSDFAEQEGFPQKLDKNPAVWGWGIDDKVIHGLATEMHDSGFSAHLELFDKTAPAALAQAQHFNDVYVVTACPPQHRGSRAENLDELGFKIPDDKLILAEDKMKVIIALDPDICIEDSPKNIEKMLELGYTVYTPSKPGYVTKFPTPKHIMYDNLAEILL